MVASTNGDKRTNVIIPLNAKTMQEIVWTNITVYFYFADSIRFVLVSICFEVGVVSILILLGTKILKQSFKYSVLVNYR